MQSPVLRTPSARFLASATLVVVSCALLARSRLFAVAPEVAAWGITFDLTITVPLLYWFFVVRAGRATAMTMAPVFVLCTLAASLIVPRANQEFLRDLGTFAVPAAELVLIGAIARRLRRAGGRKAIRDLLGDSRIADAVESEVTILYYAFFGWRKDPEEVEGRPITFHERSGWSAILACIFVLIAAEGIAMHLFLAKWSRLAALVWTAMDLWAVMWLLGDYHALRLHRSSLTDDQLHIRLGLRWAVTVPLRSIVKLDEVRAEKEWKRKDVMRLAILDDPRWIITLREPVVAKGLAGFRREIRAIALLPDDEEAISALRLALSRRDESSAHR